MDSYEVFEVIRREDRECVTQGLVFERRIVENGLPEEPTLTEVCGWRGKSRL